MFGILEQLAMLAPKPKNNSRYPHTGRPTPGISPYGVVPAMTGGGYLGNLTYEWSCCGVVQYGDGSSECKVKVDAATRRASQTGAFRPVKKSSVSVRNSGSSYGDPQSLSGFEQIQRQLVNNSPYTDTTFTGALTDEISGQAFIMKGSFRGQSVAIKMFISSNGSGDHVQSKDNEVESLRQLRSSPPHANIMQYLTHYSDPWPAIVYPLMKPCVEPPGKFTVAQVRKYAKDIANGLAFMHARNIAHLDLKPQNILFDDKDNAVLIDFGMASSFSGDDGFIFCGTIPFMAPEILKEWFPYRDSFATPPLPRVSSVPHGNFAKVDIFAYSMTLYQLLTGNYPWALEVQLNGDTNNDVTNILEAMEQRKRPPKHPSWDATLSRIIESGWSENPAQRMDAASILAAL